MIISRHWPIVLCGMTVWAPALAAQYVAPERLDSIFRPFDNTRSPGCAAAVVARGEAVFRRGYGMANLDLGVAITPASVFRTGSLSKQFTAAAMLSLADDGSLALTDDVRTHVPELPQYDAPVTIDHLLHHTSGIRDYLTLMYLAGRRDDDFYTDADVLTMLTRQRELNFPAGSDFLYSNSGYLLLAEIVHRVSGQSLRAYARDVLFRPLGMYDTHFHDDHTEIVAQRASGYAPSPDGGYRISMTTLDMVGDGGVFTSLDDVIRWIRVFYHQQGMSPMLRDAMLRRGTLTHGDTIDYAHGVRHGTYRGQPTVGHGGAFVGFRSDLVHFTDAGLTFVALCNLSTANPGALTRRMADVVLERQLAEPTPAVMTTTAAADPRPTPSPIADVTRLAAFTGTYYSAELDVTYRITLEDGTLHLTVPPGIHTPLTADSVTTLRARSAPLTLRFDADDPGATAFVLEAGRVRNLRFVRGTMPR